MSVLVIAQLKFKDVTTYRRYQGRFFDVFKRFSGKVLVADESPKVLEGEWDRDKVVVLEFPDEAEALRFHNSTEYQDIAKDRKAGADGIVILVHGFKMPR